MNDFAGSLRQGVCHRLAVILDRSQVRTGNGPRVMTSLRNLTIAILWLTGHANVAAALCYHARQSGMPRCSQQQPIMSCRG